MKQNCVTDPYRNAVGLVWAKVEKNIAAKSDYSLFFPVTGTELYWIQIAYIVEDEIYPMTDLFDDDEIYALVLEASLRQ
jgi:hypothetical protein